MDYNENLQYAISEHHKGNISEALRVYLEVIEKAPDLVEPVIYAAAVLRQNRAYSDALHIIDKYLSLHPDNGNIWFEKAVTIRAAGGDMTEAIYCLEKAHMLQPRSHAVCNNLGLLYEMTGDMIKATYYYSRGFKLKPDDMTICANYIQALDKQKLYDTAIIALESMLSYYPENPEIFNGIGNLHWKKGDSTKAKDYYIKSLQCKSDYALAHFNLGLIMREWNKLDEALVCFKNAVRFDTGISGAYLNLGETYQVLGEIESAEKIFADLVASRKEYYDAYHNLLLTINYNEKYSIDKISICHRKWGEEQSIGHHTFDNIREPEKLLRIGYVSPDFCKHPVAQFLWPVFENQGRDVENYCYAQVIHNDSKTQDFKSKCAEWIETQGLTDNEMMQRVRQDKIDILVDCAGHMGGNRLGVFALRAAPLQVSAFGYPCTSGLQSIDYRITDNVTDNNESQQYYTEKLLYLDRCFCTFAPLQNTPDIGPLPALKNGYMTFGSLHTTSRLNQAVINLWAEILQKIKSSRLIIFRTTLTSGVIGRLRKWFEMSGVDLSRIEFISDIPEKGYLDIYNKIDCQLDTFPWSGHTTACESLWMGVPVITLSGERYAARMVTSVLYHCGMRDWCADSREDYLQKAIDSSKDISRLIDLRMNLRSELLQSELMNNAGYAKEIEKQYRKIWVLYCKSQTIDL